MVLGSFISNHEYQGLAALLDKWPPTIYDQKQLIASITREMERGENDHLKRALVKLYTDTEQHKEALEIFLTLKDPDEIFKFIREKNLYTNIATKVLKLVNLRQNEAIALLIDNTDKIPINQVVAQLQDYPLFLHQYLDGLFQKDHNIAVEHHEKQIELYVMYKQDFLLKFLNASENLGMLHKARTIFKEKKLYRELAFVLDRLGSSAEALHLYIVQLEDVNSAIDFVLEKKDQDLWKTLITYSLSSPKLVAELLTRMGVLEDPLGLIKRIPTQTLCDEEGDRLNDPPLSEASANPIDFNVNAFGINDRPSVILFLDRVPEGSKDGLVQMFTTNAKNYKQTIQAAANKKAARTDSEVVLFFFSTEPTERTTELRRQFGLVAIDEKAVGHEADMVYVNVPEAGKFAVWLGPDKNNLFDNTVTHFIEQARKPPKQTPQMLPGQRHGTAFSSTLIEVEHRVLGMEIGDLKAKLIRILKDAGLELLLLKGCQTILGRDCAQLSVNAQQQRSRPVHLPAALHCSACALEFAPSSSQSRSAGLGQLVVFHCSHVYHKACVSDDAGTRPFCNLCKSASNLNRKKLK
eukprot:c16865_g1_i2.p1 GENE.c16865_g1_i2~~c16865_g1_i2.p1  ORF type:complete len:579 (+),score=178.99 c16865_g1_i2:1692-3428(+)